MSEHEQVVSEVHRVPLNDAELGLLVMMLLEDALANKDSPMQFENIVTQEKANSADLLTKLLKIKMQPRISRRVM